MSFANLHKALLKIIKKNKKCKNENMQTANLQVKRGLTFERKIQKGRRRNMYVHIWNNACNGYEKRKKKKMALGIMGRLERRKQK